MSPARVTTVHLLPSKKMALVIVPDNQLSLAIGKEGQNARLAARLTGWKIDIKSETQAEESKEEIEALLAEEEEYLSELEVLEEEDYTSAEDSDAEEAEYYDEQDEEYEEEEYEDEEYFEETGEDVTEQFETEEESKKKTKKRAKRRERARDLYDEMEEGLDLFEDIVRDDDGKSAKTPQEETELVFAEEDSSGFTIGQLLADELKEKFNLDPKNKSAVNKEKAQARDSKERGKN